MANIKNVARAFLSKVLKMTDGEIDSLLDESDTNTDDNAITALLAKDTARVSQLTQPKPGQTFQDGYKKVKGSPRFALSSPCLSLLTYRA